MECLTVLALVIAGYWLPCIIESVQQRTRYYLKSRGIIRIKSTGANYRADHYKG